MEHLTGPIIGLMLVQRNHTVLDMRQGILNFPFFSMQLKTADHKYSNVLEPILNPSEITIPPKDRVLIRTNSLLYPENAVTGLFQPSDLLHEEGDITFCPALVTLNDGSILIPVNNFTDHPYKLKKGLHIANFSILTPEQMKYVKPIDPASTWHFLQQDQSKRLTMSAVSSRRIKTRKIEKITGFQLRRTQTTQKNIHQYRKRSYENYRPYRTWRPLIPQKIQNLGQSSQKTSTGKTPLWLLKTRRKSKTY